MPRLVRTLAAAALALTALAAAPARAGHDCDAHRAPPPRARYLPAPPVSWREAQLRELHHDRAQLERSRERFYATWDGRRRSQRRFEAWYSERRLELDRRWVRLTAIARHDHDRDGQDDRWER